MSDKDGDTGSNPDDEQRDDEAKDPPRGDAADGPTPLDHVAATELHDRLVAEVEDLGASVAASNWDCAVPTPARIADWTKQINEAFRIVLAVFALEVAADRDPARTAIEPRVFPLLARWADAISPATDVANRQRAEFGAGAPLKVVTTAQALFSACAGRRMCALAGDAMWAAYGADWAAEIFQAMEAANSDFKHWFAKDLVSGYVARSLQTKFDEGRAVDNLVRAVGDHEAACIAAFVEKAKLLCGLPGQPYPDGGAR